MEEDSTKDLYQRRINGYLWQADHNPEIETEWEYIQGVVWKATRKVLGVKKISKRKHGLRAWDRELETLVKKKEPT